MFDSATSLLNHLLQLDCPLALNQGASISRASSGTWFPFAEIISLWSTDMICAKVTHVMIQYSEETTALSPSHQRSIEDPAFNHLIDTLLGVIDRCIRYPSECILCSSNSGSTSQYHTDHISESCQQKPSLSRLVNTRICDLLTRLVAKLDSEVGIASGIKPQAAPKVNKIRSPDSQVCLESVTRNTKPAKSNRALWKNIGLERRSVLAMCCLAEQMMIDEGAENCEDSTQEEWLSWMKEMIDAPQDWSR